MQHPQRRKDC